MATTPTTAFCVVLAQDSQKVLVKDRPVTTFEEVKAIHLRYPRNDIAVFENRGGVGGEMWAFYPEIDDPKWYR